MPSRRAPVDRSSCGDSLADIVHATQRAAAAIPNARIQALDGHGHFAHKTDPATVTAAVRDFVSAARPAPHIGA